jgi:hypothetical protein
VLQAIFQGFVVTVVSLVLYGRAIALIGVSGAAFGALVPALSALIAIPLLGEWPGRSDWVGIGLISSGVYLASGGPICQRGARRHLISTPEPGRRLEGCSASEEAFDAMRVRALRKWGEARRQ